MMSSLTGLSPKPSLLAEGGSLYEFETAHGTVLLHEVDCVEISYFPRTATLVIRFEWDLDSTVGPPSPELRCFTLEFNNVSIQSWSSYSKEIQKDSLQNSQIRSFTWDCTYLFEMELADEKFSFMATKCSIQCTEIE